MSVIRLVMLERKKARSGLIPSRSLGAVLWAVSEGARDISSLWSKVAPFDPTLEEHFLSTEDDQPLLEGAGDGLLVISWEFRCIESFQEFQPVRLEGVAWRHNGNHTVDDDPVPFRIAGEWHVIDHSFEEP